MAHRAALSSRPMLIDLTQSDDENCEEPSRVQESHLSPRRAPPSVQDLPASNHGLILSRTFDNVRVEIEVPSKGFLASHTIFTQFDKDVSLQPANQAPNKISHRLPTRARELDGSRNNMNRRRAGYSFSKGDSGSRKSSVHLLANHPVKRRKTHGEMTSAERLNRAPIKAPVISTKAQEDLAFAGIKRTSGTRNRVEKSSQVENNFKPQESRSRPPKFSQILKEEQKLNYKRDFAENHILKPVRQALRPYHKLLSQVQLKNITREAARRLLSQEPNLFDKFQATHWTVDERKELMDLAQGHVDDVAANAALNAQAGVESNNSYSLPLQPSRRRHLTAETARSRRATRSTSRATTNPGLEGTSPLSSDDRAQGQTLLSPPTSFDYKFSEKDPEPKLEQSNQQQPQIPSIAANPSSTPIFDGMENQISREAELRQLRKAQSERIASLDPTLSRPYMSFSRQEKFRQGLECLCNSEGLLPADARRKLEETILHIEFCQEEMEFIWVHVLRNNGAERHEDLDPALEDLDLKREITHFMRGRDSDIPKLCNSITAAIKKPSEDIGCILLRKREDMAFEAFLQDAAAEMLTRIPSVVHVDFKPPQRIQRAPMSLLLMERETWGLAPVRVCRGQQPFEVECASYLEDSITRQSEWTDCSGDLTSLTWTGSKSFICAATAHSDLHNMQYNKPGNLAVGSSILNTLRSVGEHRIKRPIVMAEENTANALNSMRQTQDPWLYSSVVSTTHSELSGYTFTSSFDKTVKVWKVSDDGSSMDLQGSWLHDGKVNFVAASNKHERVATATDVGSNAIRVYNLGKHNIGDISYTAYDTYSGDKAQEQVQEVDRKGNWAYFPATIQWGICPGVENFLLVGYSPRSTTSDDSDIPEDKRNTGELCLWNVEECVRIPISSARTQNVFEVMWHPTQPMFLAATSPCGEYGPETKTQIRLFAQNEFGTFMHTKALDCRAADVNELAIWPNSILECYVAAGCTDGNTYVWDTAQGDRPIHILGHGESLNNPYHDQPREVADEGIKFAAWGRTLDRFYTGASDGKVKAWDIKAPRNKAFVRTVLELSGGVTCGAFLKDFSKLLIGDATGKVHLLGMDDDDGDESGSSLGDSPISQTATGLHLGNLSSTRRRPKVLIPHPEPEPPAGYMAEEQETARDMALKFLNEGHITQHPDQRIGAIQGPNYGETIYCNYEAHEDNDGTKPLRPEWQAQQQEQLLRPPTELKIPRLSVKLRRSSAALHVKNSKLDLDISSLSASVRDELERDGVDFGFAPDSDFEYELLPRERAFKGWNKDRKCKVTKEDEKKSQSHLKTAAEAESEEWFETDQGAVCGEKRPCNELGTAEDEVGTDEGTVRGEKKRRQENL